MANKSLTVDKKEFGAIMKKLSDLGLTATQFDEELKQSAKNIRDKAKADFESKSAPHLARRGESTAGLSSSIKVRRLARKNGTGSAYNISAGGVGKKLMAFIEFGTRAESINLSGITSLFGSSGSSYAKRFKGGDSPKSFTHLSARPYFFHNVFYRRKNCLKGWVRGLTRS